MNPTGGVTTVKPLVASLPGGEPGKGDGRSLQLGTETVDRAVKALADCLAGPPEGADGTNMEDLPWNIDSWATAGFGCQLSPWAR